MWFGKKRAEARLNSELRYHLDKLTEEHIAAGMSRETARLTSPVSSAAVRCATT